MMKSNVRRGTLQLMSKLNTPLCIINAYPYKGYWCNDAWCMLWEVANEDEWKERASNTMENWSEMTHKRMSRIRDTVQLQKQTSYTTFTIYRNNQPKVINVCQHPFEWENGKTLMLYESVSVPSGDNKQSLLTSNIPAAPEKSVLHVSLKRSVEAFRYTVAIITVFKVNDGSLVYQNPASDSFYPKKLIESVKLNPRWTGVSMMELFLQVNDDSQVVYSSNQEEEQSQKNLFKVILAQVSERKVWSGYTITHCKYAETDTIIRRRLNATYGLDPDTGDTIVVLDESYSIEQVDDVEENQSDTIVKTASVPETAAAVEGSVFYQGAAGYGKSEVKVPMASNSLKDKSLSFANAMIRSLKADKKVETLDHRKRHDDNQRLLTTSYYMDSVNNNNNNDDDNDPEVVNDFQSAGTQTQDEVVAFRSTVASQTTTVADPGACSINVLPDNVDELKKELQNYKKLTLSLLVRIKDLSVMGIPESMEDNNI